MSLLSVSYISVVVPVNFFMCIVFFLEVCCFFILFLNKLCFVAICAFIKHPSTVGCPYWLKCKHKQADDICVF